MSSHPYCAKTLHVFFPHTSLSNGSPSIRNWSASLSEFPTEIVFLCFTPFSLGPSILLVSSSRDVPIVSTWTAQLLPLLFPSPPFSPIAYSDRLSPGSPACTTGLSCQMPLSTSASIFANKTFPAGLLLAMVSKSSAKCKIVCVSNTNTAANTVQVYHTCIGYKAQQDFKVGEHCFQCNQNRNADQDPVNRTLMLCVMIT